MNAKIEKFVIVSGIEIPVDVPAEEEIFRVSECVDAVERAESFDYVLGTSSSYVAPAEATPSAPLSAGAIRVVNSVLSARVPESAIRRDPSGDF